MSAAQQTSSAAATPTSQNSPSAVKPLNGAAAAFVVTGGCAPIQSTKSSSSTQQLTPTSESSPVQPKNSDEPSVNVYSEKSSKHYNVAIAKITQPTVGLQKHLRTVGSAAANAAIEATLSATESASDSAEKPKASEASAAEPLVIATTASNLDAVTSPTSAESPTRKKSGDVIPVPNDWARACEDYLANGFCALQQNCPFVHVENDETATVFHTPSLSALYRTLSPGVHMPIWRPAAYTPIESTPPQMYPSDEVLATKGSLLYTHLLKRGTIPAMKLQHCFHYANGGLCTFGPNCKFIHVVQGSLAEPQKQVLGQPQRPISTPTSSKASEHPSTTSANPTPSNKRRNQQQGGGRISHTNSNAESSNSRSNNQQQQQHDTSSIPSSPMTHMPPMQFIMLPPQMQMQMQMPYMAAPGNPFFMLDPTTGAVRPTMPMGPGALNPFMANPFMGMFMPPMGPQTPTMMSPIHSNNANAGSGNHHHGRPHSTRNSNRVKEIKETKSEQQQEEATAGQLEEPNMSNLLPEFLRHNKVTTKRVVNSTH